MRAYYQLYGIRFGICVILAFTGFYFNCVYLALLMVVLYSSYEYTFRRPLEQEPVVIDATGILLEDVKTSSKWWFRVDAKCLANLTLYHDIGKSAI